MKAAVRSTYGASEVLSVKEIDIPTPKDNEVLIRVHAATVNRSDCHVLTGKPYAMRLFTGLSKPKLATTGCDFAGEIAATGRGVTAFKPGDKIMGFGGGLGSGSHAQYFILRGTTAAKAIVPMAANLTYAEAAACLEGAFYALNSVKGIDPKPGQKALVIGATGAIGAATVQFLKYYGVSVTATCRGEHEALVRSLGAERMIDYTKKDFTKDNERYDLIFDSVGKSSFFKCKHLLKKNGKYTSSNGIINFFLILITSILGGKKVVFKIAVRIKAGLQFIKELIEEGKFVPVTDRIYPLERIADAYSYVMTGQKVGNVVIIMDN